MVLIFISLRVLFHFFIFILFVNFFRFCAFLGILGGVPSFKWCSGMIIPGWLFNVSLSSQSSSIYVIMSHPLDL